MANYANLEAAIQAAIYENNTNDITGAALQTVLLQMVSDMGKSGMLCNGVCDGNTVPPVAPDSNIFYIAPTGTYSNFGGLTVADGEWAIFIYNGGWQKQSIPVVTADAVPTTGSTNPVQSGGVADALDTKADIDGYYSTLTAGSAENLIGRGTVPAEYTRRTSGGSADIGSGAAAIEKIHGNTIAWNQKVTNGDFALNSGWGGVDGTVTISGGVGTYTITTVMPDFYNNQMRQSITNCVNGHKYYYGIDCKASKAMFLGGLLFGARDITPSATAFTRFSGVTTYTGTTGSHYIYMCFGSGATRVVGDSFDVRNIFLCDLTLMFGAGNEPSTAAEFEALFPLNYYAYNTGSLVSLTGTGIETNGFNQWDEDWELGSIDNSGQTTPSSYQMRSKNYIPVFPSTTYYYECKVSAYANTYIEYYWYDAEKNFISNNASNNHQTFTSPANAYYFKFRTNNAWAGATYTGGICFNLSWSGYRNGEYEAYWDSTLALPITTVTSGGSAVFADGMKSCPVAYDELTSTKAIKRCDKRAYTAGDESDSTVITDGTNTIYALTTPVEYTLDSEVNLNYRVDDFGTETLLPQNNATPTTAPIIYDVRYAMNAVDTLRNLPKNYISKDSMEHILNAMVTAGVISAYTLTWNATNENYDCTITA